MRSIIEIRANDLTPAQLRDEIKERDALLAEWGGWLYPSILKDEIDEIHNIIQRKEKAPE